ncbi:hypothetical protein P154DRAFT_33983 [Amniculicola lignicola CBS 123094]|uniref:Secreted protein n=1 Tax=Amniculicola lignicola CBS 123094 TaxID=1392246 RepID=A0A6A5WRT7_9PLEO|nr:hypothetical protein P154DRAFT_33983 [Amniculicola lignicola CBS 123094]
MQIALVVLCVSGCVGEHDPGQYLSGRSDQSLYITALETRDLCISLGYSLHMVPCMWLGCACTIVSPCEDLLCPAVQHMFMA